VEDDFCEVTLAMQHLVSFLLLFGAAIPASLAASSVSWIEAEAYESQRGSTAPRFDMPAASGGACVDNNWGGQAGHLLRYKVELAADFQALHVTLRYAREMAGAALVSVTLGADTNTTRIVKLPSTGDWGFKPEGWSYPSVRLPATPKGAHTLELLSLADRNNVNFEGFYSRGVWPYLSAEVALWHLRLGETNEAWRILRALVDRASSTACWYEEIDHQPQRGHGDPADVWAAAETVYLARQLLLASPAEKAQERSRQ
jgi:hypothetical protein